MAESHHTLGPIVLNDHMMHYLLADEGSGWSVHLLRHLPVDNIHQVLLIIRDMYQRAIMLLYYK